MKSGKTKRTYLQAGPAGAQARTFLNNAGKSPGDLAGRMVALAVMARYADEDAVAQSSRSFAQVDGGVELPWSLETVELIDELAAGRLPDHLLARGREQREEQAAHRREVAENREWGRRPARRARRDGPHPARPGRGRSDTTLRRVLQPCLEFKHRIRELDAAHEADRSAETAEGAGAAHPEEGAA